MNYKLIPFLIPKIYPLIPFYGDLFQAKLYKSDLLKFHWIAENFYRFLFYCGLDIAKHDAHFKLKTGFSIKYICKPLETKNKPIGRLI